MEAVAVSVQAVSGCFVATDSVLAATCCAVEPCALCWASTNVALRVQDVVNGTVTVVGGRVHARAYEAAAVTVAGIVSNANINIYGATLTALSVSQQRTPIAVRVAASTRAEGLAFIMSQVAVRVPNGYALLADNYSATTCSFVVYETSLSSTVSRIAAPNVADGLHTGCNTGSDGGPVYRGPTAVEVTGNCTVALPLQRCGVNQVVRQLLLPTKATPPANTTSPPAPPDTAGDMLEWWEILLIVLGCIIFVALVAIGVFFGRRRWCVKARRNVEQLYGVGDGEDI
jgi:hypothetical protein